MVGVEKAHPVKTQPSEKILENHQETIPERENHKNGETELLLLI